MAGLMFSMLLIGTLQDKHRDPPKGPPWKTDYREARWESLRTGRPIFLYFTKTY
jgi:hypothetical protein